MKQSFLVFLAALAVSLSSTAYAESLTAPGYMIANYTITDQAGFQRYMDAAGSLAPRYGGKIIVFNLNAKAVEGKPESVMAIAEFPSLADAQRFYNSPEYTAARKFRIESTKGTVVITEGFVPAK
ncbi:hypothetical protein A584_28216 [Pseudomonas syringae pv. theae ICMP 3923]|uniref:DUF1330 domain-containing protein n=1 Tax=Pseudomonas syringae pv. theae TaxID=103985 RepID=A0A0Q0KZ45_PSESX|nr:DUF1330 domain-containing protein [Pseudomonas syringae]EPM65568.1 hypothetical protein A584_28216 [Pseudomonas syringae pv. theae ICMP 3923]KPZ33808.1 hypothetical protein AN901_205426 [Pseudomonas syringae pv. theae]MBL3875835.1 DUF1330 domain-containing protein [Pseudomonas syringae pv. theae]RMT65200.1 hypothetical protein ALP44_02216 [Pseudomonas syringae pv. theae]GKQ33346.1 DUF1330 domain-containing protein [Pseudomonas syringae pv. theae]